MAERLSPLAGLALSRGNGGATLREVAVGSILRIQAWPDTLSEVTEMFGPLFGMDARPVGQAVSRDGATLATLSPGIFMVAGMARDVAWLEESGLTVDKAAVTDLSHGRTILSLEGERAAEVLQGCVPLDLDPAAFPPGRVAQTAIHHIDVIFHRRAEDAFELWALRSFAAALAEWIVDAGAEAGAGFRSG